MSEWKGEWKCAKCGRILDPDRVAALGFHWSDISEDVRCDGELIPHDRRAPTQADALLREAREALRLVGWPSDNAHAHWPYDETLPARIDAYLKEREE